MYMYMCSTVTCTHSTRYQDTTTHRFITACTERMTEIPDYLQFNDMDNTPNNNNDMKSPSEKSSSTSTGYPLEMTVPQNRNTNYKNMPTNLANNEITDEAASIFTPYGTTGKTLGKSLHQDNSQHDDIIAEKMFDSTHINYERTTTPTTIHDFLLGKEKPNSNNVSHSNSNSDIGGPTRILNKHLQQVSQNISPANEKNRSMSPLSTIPPNTAFNNLDFPINTMLDNTYQGRRNNTQTNTDLNTVQLDTVLDNYMTNERSTTNSGASRNNLNLDLGDIDNIRRHSEVSNNNLIPEMTNNRASISHQMDFWNMQNVKNAPVQQRFDTLVEPVDDINYDNDQQKMDKELSQILGDYNLNFIDPFTSDVQPTETNNTIQPVVTQPVMAPMTQVRSYDNATTNFQMDRKHSLIEDPSTKKKFVVPGVHSPQSPRQTRQYSVGKKQQHRYSVPNLHAPLNNTYLPQNNQGSNNNNNNNNMINVVPWKNPGSPTSNNSFELENHQPRRILSADGNIPLNFGNSPPFPDQIDNSFFNNEYLNNNLSTGNINANVPLQFPTGTSNMYGNSSMSPNNNPQFYNYQQQQQQQNYMDQAGRSKSTTIANFGRTYKSDLTMASTLQKNLAHHTSRNSISSRQKSRTPSIPNLGGTTTTTIDENDKPFTCTTCGKSFRRSEHLRRHIRSVHSQERPFACTLCDKKFSRSDNLSQHLKTHKKK